MLFRSPPGTRGRLVFATDENRRAAARFIGSVRAAGGTRHADALVTAFRLDPDVVFLLTDADAKDDLGAEEIVGQVLTVAAAAIALRMASSSDFASSGTAP